ncbi:MAG TPA: hypothetical protein VMV66_01640 [Candidatus Humimicrobiaceae bacterium]|nr:hypothetical protein [Candidatus Humimicrobiaceae bacterium]
MKKVKEWFVNLLPVGALIAVSFLFYVRKLATGENALSGLAYLMEPKKEDWIAGVSEAVTAMKV